MRPSKVGVILVGHGSTASQLLTAAASILPRGALDDVVAVDAGRGETPWLSHALYDHIAAVDQGRGVLMLVDLMGSSPCRCGEREGGEHQLVVASGLSLAMLLKLASLDRSTLSPVELAEACAESARRAVVVNAPEAERSGGLRP